MSRYIFVSDFSKKIGGGFRDCMFLDLNFPPGDSRRAVCFIAKDVSSMAQAFRAIVFQPGEWEAPHICAAVISGNSFYVETNNCPACDHARKGIFPAISPALLEEIAPGKTESELAL